LPTLSQRKNTGPFESILIKRAINGKRGIAIDIPIIDKNISTDLLIIINFYPYLLVYVYLYFASIYAILN